MAAILVFYTDFQVAPPLESYLLASTKTTESGTLQSKKCSFLAFLAMYPTYYKGKSEMKGKERKLKKPRSTLLVKNYSKSVTNSSPVQATPIRHLRRNIRRVKQMMNVVQPITHLKFLMSRNVCLIKNIFLCITVATTSHITSL